jgi:hypothetical protein
MERPRRARSARHDRIAWRGAAAAFVIAVAVSAVGTSRAVAHHSLTAYDMDRKVTLDAVVREFHFVNPHPFIVADVRSGGSMVSWKLELDNRFELVEAGMSADTLKAGERLTVTGVPGRSGAKILYVRELDRRADGFHYEQPGSTPSISRRPPS